MIGRGDGVCILRGARKKRVHLKDDGQWFCMPGAPGDR
jgi:hypothetical protein